ncbi:MAG: chromate transporter [Christensenellaceae bacterium]|jgi:chromate transporter|nr:chromate transporter [Christensenellaceae bacterium]
MANAKLRSLWGLFCTFFKAGTFTFAGGLAMLPVIEKDVVEHYGFMDKDQFLEYATLSQTLPGVIALNCASFVGRHVAGTMGMLAAGLGSTISAFILMLAATIAIQFIPQAGPALGAMRAIRAASSALVLSAAWSLGQRNLKSAFALVVMLAIFALVVVFDVSAPLCVLLAGLAGYLYQRFRPKKAAGEANQGAAKGGEGK